jgi:hypothetical protein
MSPYDPNAMLSTHYSLGDLIATTKQLSQPNFPSDSSHYDNLVLLADMLERLDTQVGPFTLLSGYRTKELQNILTAAGEPTSKGLSFHEIGRAVDISPTTMTIAEYFGQILANEDLKNQFAEIAIKPSQNALHLSINVPGDVRDPKVTGLDSSGTYAALSVDDVANYIAPYMASATDAFNYAETQVVNTGVSPMMIGVGLAVALGAFMLLGKSKRSVA